MPYGNTFESAWINSFKNLQVRSAWAADRSAKREKVVAHLKYVIAVEPELDANDINKLTDLAVLAIAEADERLAEKRRIEDAIVRAGLQEESLKAQAALTASYRVNGQLVVVMLDNDQLKHQPREHPIGNRRAEGEKFLVANASPAWHEDNTMKFMAAWAANTELPVGGTLAFKQGEKYLLNGVLAVSFEGNYKNINNKRYVLFHCYPNSRAQVQAKVVPWDLTTVVKQ